VWEIVRRAWNVAEADAGERVEEAADLDVEHAALFVRAFAKKCGASSVEHRGATRFNMHLLPQHVMNPFRTTYA
jgi:hypothetical protein